MAHINCNICKRNIFTSRADFLEAHGGVVQFIPINPWVPKTVRKGPLSLLYKVKCETCHSDQPPQHKTTCKYYWEPKTLEKIEIFDWESYWIFWFMVETLDLKSQRFFGKKDKNI